MGLRSNPTQRQRRLGAELRRLRLAAGLSVAEAAAAAGLGPPHLGHIEAARTAIPEVKLRALMAAYGCRSESLVNALVAMSVSSGRGWWSDYKRHVGGRGTDLAELEASATSSRSFQWLYIPGLLQTPDYIRTLLAAGERDADEELLDTYVEFRLGRQRVLTEGSLHLHAVIHETALRMRFVPGDIMRAQLEHLLRMALLPQVRIQILPLSATFHPPAFSSPFVLYEAGVPELGTVYVEQPVASPFLSEQQHLAAFTTSFQELASAALDPIDPQSLGEFHARRDSLGLIQHVLYTLCEATGA
ncbi:helix-turn-helix domain-containing protein [Streptomyces caatingaensis]|uniref:XRE family transcriptional regulator n=1 Tax=Streptomyces caatingaensis TaxID=1678637 RepID=A0A0K9XDD1_9ACTN|nr:helix-turn-helix transcriptional regulator [Streptomyces caatingaensis]KNB51390.1 XRE family transcriptional regulator [Streptomyces caatingaensis]